MRGVEREGRALGDVNERGEEHDGDAREEDENSKRGARHCHHLREHLHPAVVPPHLEQAQHTHQAQHADDSELGARGANGQFDVEGRDCKEVDDVEARKELVMVKKKIVVDCMTVVVFNHFVQSKLLF